jgi:hypothetical protein
MVLKSTNGRQNHHTQQAGLRMCCELALKSAGKWNTHGHTGRGGRCGKPPARKKFTPGCRKGGGYVWCDGGNLAARLGAVSRCAGAGKLLAGHRVCRAPCAAAAPTKSASRFAVLAGLCPG